MRNLTRGSARALTNANRQRALAFNVCRAVALFVGTLFLVPMNAAAISLTYEFGGEISSIDAPVSGIGPLQLGTPFSGSFTYDTSATNINPGDNFAGYLEPFPTAKMTISVAGLTIDSTGYMSVAVFSGDRDPNFVTFGFGNSVLSSGWSNPTTIPIGLIASGPSFTYETPNLSDLPIFTIASFNDSPIRLPFGGSGGTDLPPGFSYPGGSYDAFVNVWLTLESFTLVPEPPTFSLAAFGLIGLAAWGWRRRR